MQRVYQGKAGEYQISLCHIFKVLSSLYPCFTICCPRTDAARRWKVAGIKLRAGGVFREFKRRDLTDIETFVSIESEVG